MAKSVRQQARVRARKIQAERMRARLEAERRRCDLGVEVSVALEERDSAIARLELLAGRALLTLLREEGLTLAEVQDWVPNMPTSEVRRLRKIAEIHERPRRAGEGTEPI